MVKATIFSLLFGGHQAGPVDKKDTKNYKPNNTISGSVNAAPSVKNAGAYSWKVRNDWTPEMNKKFSDFVATIGNSGCKNLNDCLTDPASNPMYASRTPIDNPYLADCADLPFMLRMYFSWMEGLPFDYVNVPVQANPEEETSTDIRYTKFGNKPGSMRRLVKGRVYNALKEMEYLRDAVSTATYRMHYEFVSDFYPPALDRQNIIPGTVVYDPSGHAAIVYKIEKDGRIKMMDAHPDQSITHITYDQKFTRSRAAHGAGFRNWRPEGNDQPSSDLVGFSEEQFNKNFVIGEETVTYYDFVRARMAGGDLKFNPVLEMKSMMTELCSNVHDRELAVNEAIKNMIMNKDHPAKLPNNIYGTDGEWEEFSSPSRDARLKVAFVELRNETARFIQMYKEGNPRVVYTPKASKYSGNCGKDKNCMLIASLLTAYEQVVMSPSCIFSYQKSDGSTKRLSYTDIANRLFKLSFDPYHCIELRWGASGQELASCQDDSTKMEWYKAEQNLRNQTERTYDARMDYDVRGTAANLGVEQAPDIDLWGYLANQL